jgi:hypothetical protein
MSQIQSAPTVCPKCNQTMRLMLVKEAGGRAKIALHRLRSTRPNESGIGRLDKRRSKSTKVRPLSRQVLKGGLCRSLTEPIFIVPTDFTHIIARWLSSPRVRELPRRDAAVGQANGYRSQTSHQSVPLLRVQPHRIGDALRPPQLAASFYHAAIWHVSDASNLSSTTGNDTGQRRLSRQQRSGFA